MDPRLLEYYNRELRYIREVGGEFAEQYPKIAERLGLDSFECADPYVERLLEGFAFLAARVQLKLDARFPTFTQHLFELVYPHYLAPTPAMTMVQFRPDESDGSLVDGFRIARDTALHADIQLPGGDRRRIEFRTAMDVVLWPIALREAEYLAGASRLPDVALPGARAVKGGLRLRLATTADIGFDVLATDRLDLFVHGADELPSRILEQVLAHCVAVVAQPPDGSWREVLPADRVEPLGFDEDQALLPHVDRSFSGYRLLHEYFAFPERYRMFGITGLQPVLRRASGGELDLYLLLDVGEIELERDVDAEMFRLNCTPAINLFPKRLDRIHLNDQDTEYHVVPDRSRPLDFEVAQITRVTGFGADQSHRQEFLPFYSAVDPDLHVAGQAYYTVRREQRLLSSRQKRQGKRTSYIGGEVYLSLVDPDEAPYRADLRQLAVHALCTNRDLPLLMGVGHAESDFVTELSAPITAIRCVAGPSRPHASHAEGETGWRLVSHLSLNYLSLADGDRGEEGGANALRELLDLYAFRDAPELRKQVEGLVSIGSKPIYRRLPSMGSVTFGRGLEIGITFDESAFEGSGCFVLGMVLDRFLAKYVSLNSFTETVIHSTTRGELARWPARIGQRRIL